MRKFTLGVPFIATALVATLIGAPTASLRAAPSAFPGETDPIGGDSPSRLTQYHDDEIALVSSSANDGFYWIQEFPPNPDYTLPVGPTSDVLPFPPTTTTDDGLIGFQHNFSVAQGRIVTPTRDVAMTLTKIGYIASTATITWALQEMSFGSNAATPPTVPAITFAAKVVPYQLTAINSPGALAVGDLDKAVDAQGLYHDEVVLAYETFTGNQVMSDTDVLLSVEDYAINPGQATPTTYTVGLPGGRFAYPCNISYRYYAWQPTGFNDSGCALRHPGALKVAVGDLDGDGFNDIALVAHTYSPVSQLITLQAYMYSYCPPITFAASDPRAQYCPSGTSGFSLVYRGLTNVADPGPDTGRNANNFQNPVDISVGDLDGDGKDELTVVHLTNQRYDYEPFEDDKYLGDVTLSVVAWTAGANLNPDPLKSIGVVVSATTRTVDAWFDGLGEPGDTPIHYHDVRVATGLFKFSPNLGYGLSRRQIAVAYEQQKQALQLELWDVTSPNSPMDNPPTAWTMKRYTELPKTIPYCGDWYASFGLVAGNWAGVKLNPSSTPLWGLAVSYETNTDIRADLYRVDQNVITTTAEGPLTYASSSSIPKGGAITAPCGRQSRNALVSFDYDGDSLQLGAPAHGVLDIPQQFDYILQEPPQHLDYFPDGGWVNVSRRSDFNVSYAQSQGESFSTNTTKTSSWTGGVAQAANVTVGAGADAAGLIKGKFSVSISEQFHYDYAENKQDYVGVSDAYSSKLQAQTSGGDSLEFRSKVIDVWRYPIYGITSTVPGNPYSYYELYLPRANNTPAQNMDDLLAQAYGYQPVHENGNALSYPVAPASTSYTPPDIGTWLLPTSTVTNSLAVPCENDQSLCIAKPLSENDHQFNWGRDNTSLSLEIDHTLTQGQSRDWTKKWSLSADVEASAKFAYFTGSDSACLNVQAHGGETWGEGATSVSTSTETDALTINIPSNQDDSNAYHFNPVMYVTQDGTLKVAQAAGLDNGGPLWGQRYNGPDPALNLPRKFNYPSGATAWEINKDWMDARQIRGFFVRSSKLNPLSNTYDVVDGIKAGETVFLQTRLYNYSIGAQAPALPLRFDLEPVDPLNNFAPTGPRVTLGITTTGAIPYHGQLDGLSNPLANWIPVSYTLDTSDLSFAGLSQAYRVWVVVDPQGTIKQTHGWRQPNVILTPEKTVSAGTVVSVTIQNAAGTALGTASYTSTGTDDDIAGGLTNALNNSPALRAFGAIANVQDMSTTTPSIVVFKTGAQPPASNEFRAGLVSGGDALYFVPPPAAANSVPLVTASNLEYGQNNEGWSLITIYKQTVPGPMLGADDPCAISGGYSAARGPDIYLQNSLVGTSVQASTAMPSLSAVDANGQLVSGPLKVLPGQKVMVRVTAFSPIDWAGFEYVTIYQGDPDKSGKVVGTAQIQGISKANGGHGWFTWYAPKRAGTYELVARLRENWNDEKPGNHTARLKVAVGPQKLYYPFMPFTPFMGGK